MGNGNSIVNMSRSWLGVPYRHQGRNRYGLDCGGLIVVTFDDLGITLKDSSGYGRMPHNNGLRKALDKNFQQVADAQAGDILLMALGATEPEHLAICAGDTLIHAYERAGKVVEQRFANAWRARVHGVYRYVW